MFKGKKIIKSGLVLMAAVVMMAVLAGCGSSEEDTAAPKATLVFAGLDWDSAQVQNGVARYIVEKGYGYPTDEIGGSTVPLFQGLRTNDIDITMEIWLPNQNKIWNEAFWQAPGERSMRAASEWRARGASRAKPRGARRRRDRCRASTRTPGPDCRRRR